ncbi:carbohydrate porin [Undibacterium sp. RuRC25W]|uniref:carbohydrate porin n=1 Tax=Undibacterium sp. RuRC25W TaxID=3413047 RepID=UPI003BF094D1
MASKYVCASENTSPNSESTANATKTIENKVDDATTLTEEWAIHGQITNVTQKHASFTSPYRGQQSLSPSGRMEETTDITLFLGRRLWKDAEIWINPEIDQGHGFNDTLGVAGFPNGGAYKVGANLPYLRFPRLFIRQTSSLGGEETTVESSANQLANTNTANNLAITVGKFAVTDIFDTNSYAHDPRADFLNWSVLDGGTYDYAADAWGFTWGGAVEWTQDWWTLRAGFFQLSPIPNGKITRIHFSGNSSNIEFEARHTVVGYPGKIKLLAWLNQGNMGSYADAITLARQTNTTPDVSQIRQFSSRPGAVLNIEQELSEAMGAFVRLSANRGNKETYEFTDINQSVAAGLSIKGDAWRRREDIIGVAIVENRISSDARAYFAAGGLGVLIGDGRLTYAPEKIAELYYACQLRPNITLTFDYQRITNPAYNQDRGPVSVYGTRVHASF